MADLWEACCGRAKNALKASNARRSFDATDARNLGVRPPERRGNF